MTTRRTITATAALALASTVALSACGSPGPVTAHGIVEDCTGTLDTGSQVTVTDSAQRVIGTAVLVNDTSKAALAAEAQSVKLAIDLGPSGTGAMMIYDFTVTVPGGEPRYGIGAGGAHGTVWLTPAQMKSPSVSLGC